MPGRGTSDPEVTPVPAAAAPDVTAPDVAAIEAAVDLLKALAAPVRLGIILELADGERCVHELVEAAGVSQSLVSQHLRVLRGAGLVRPSRRGREIAYRLGDDHVTHIVRDAITHAQEQRR